MIPLQSPGPDLILVELFLFVITGSATYVAYRTRQIWNRIDSLANQVDTNSRILVGEDGEPYDGLTPEVKENSARIKQHKRLLKRLQSAMERNGHISRDGSIDLDNGYDYGDDFMRGGGGDD